MVRFFIVETAIKKKLHRFDYKQLFNIIYVGAASRGDASEAKPEQPYPSAGGGEEQPPGAAGGGRGGTKEPGETTGNTTSPGTHNQ